MEDIYCIDFCSLYLSAVMPHPNHQAQAIADVTREVLKLVDMTTGS